MAISRRNSPSMNPKLTTPLGNLYCLLKDWMPISDFETAIKDYFAGARSKAELADYRAKRGHSKKLRDEVVPALRYIKFVKAKGEIKFELGDGVPDCWLRDNPSADPQGIEVTVAQSREQYHLGKELNEKGEGRGFLGLSDNDSSQAFATRLESPRTMYSTETALKVIGDGIKLCLVKKQEVKYAGFDLLIEAPLRSLPRERWKRILGELRAAANATHFREIHVIGNQHSEPFGFRIK
jgi:hypothetical protein